MHVNATLEDLLKRVSVLEEENLALNNYKKISQAYERELKHLSHFERVVTTISTRFINLHSSEIDQAIEKTLATVGEFAGVDRCYVFQFHEDRKELRHTHEWCAPEIEPQIQKFRRLFVNEAPFLMEKLNRLESFYVPRVASLPQEVSREKEIFLSQGIQSLIVVPMILRRSLVGFIGFDAVRMQKNWSENTISLLMIVGEIFVSALERKRIEDELQKARFVLDKRVAEHTAVLTRTNERLKREIRERVQTEAALREKEQYIQSLMNSATDVAIYRLNVDQEYPERSEIVFASPSITDILGCSDWGSIWSKKTIHKDDVERVLATNRHSIGTGEPFNQVFRVHHDKTGQWRWVHSIGIPSFDASEKPAYFNGFIIDVNEEMRAEEMLRSLINSNPESLLLIDLCGTILAANETCARRLGYRVEGLIGLSFHDVVPTDLPEEREKNIAYVIKTGKPLMFEDVRSNKYFEVHIEPIFDAEGIIEQLAVFSLERTEHKKALEDLKLSEASLRALSQRLIDAEENERKRISQELHDSIGQYVSAIKFNTENIISQVESGSRNTILEPLKATIPVIQATIDEIYKICMSLRPSVLDDFGILETMSWFCREYQEIYSDIEIVQQINVSEDDIPSRLKINILRILQEAMNNVAKHSRADSVHISLQREGTVLELCISDNGKGFDIDKLFPQPNVQSGFGLTTMRERTELTGGSFSIDSIPGQYTTVRASWNCEESG